MTQSLIGRLAAQRSVRTSVVVEVLPFLELVVEQFRVVDDHALEEAIELLCIDPMGAFDLAVEPGPVWLDIGVTDPLVEHMPVEGCLEFGSVVRLDDLDPEGETFERVVDVTGPQS